MMFVTLAGKDLSQQPRVRYLNKPDGPEGILLSSLLDDPAEVYWGAQDRTSVITKHSWSELGIVKNEEKE